MPPKFDEVDVFSIPHSRMKLLVRSCSEKVDITDFTNSDELMRCLNTLYGVFKEFKSHEEIENECIMMRLKKKLREQKIHNSAVCNCHSDDQFGPLIDLVNSGFIFINKQKTASDKLDYGMRLRKALREFIKDFVPHMKEEEEVFQPLLMEHFDSEELVEMKHLVIKLHLLQRKHYHNNDSKIDLKSENDENNKSTMNSLPNEILLKIFSSLNQRELLCLAKVSRNWNVLSYDPLQWSSLSFTEWLNMSNVKRNFNSTGIKDIEHIDESDEEFDQEILVSSNEIKMLHGWVKHLLPRIGVYLKKLDLSQCKSINNNLARRIFQLCPNLKHIDLSYSNIGDNAFKGVQFENIEYLNFEGCSKISDNTFKYLFIGKDRPKSQTILNDIHLYARNLMRQEKFLKRKNVNLKEKCDDCLKKHQVYANIEELNSGSELCKEVLKESFKCNQLKHLNLSGCFKITDSSLNFLVSMFNLDSLNYLNVSGCPNISSDSLNGFVSLTSENHLNAEDVYYCDNILNGPFGGNANCCENVESKRKFCCRNRIDFV